MKANRTIHKPARLQNGSYNYRAVCFERDARQWVIRNEDGGAYYSASTIKAMCRYIDRHIKNFP